VYVHAYMCGVCVCVRESLYAQDVMYVWERTDVKEIPKKIVCACVQCSPAHSSNDRTVMSVYAYTYLYTNTNTYSLRECVHQMSTRART